MYQPGRVASDALPIQLDANEKFLSWTSKCFGYVGY